MHAETTRPPRPVRTEDVRATKQGAHLQENFIFYVHGQLLGTLVTAELLSREGGWCFGRGELPQGEEDPSGNMEGYDTLARSSA